jgi:hypothetical protein
MAKRKKLKVLTAGKRCHISVPSGQANVLLAYLRTHRVRCAPPEPESSNLDNIELAGDTNVASVQAILNQWG